MNDIETEINRLIAQAEADNRDWVVMLKNTVLTTGARLGEAKDEYDVWTAFIDLANCLVDAAEDIKRNCRLRRGYKNVLEMLDTMKERENGE